MFATALFFSSWMDGAGRREPERTAPARIRRSAALGALAGFATLMRWQDALLLAIPVFEAVRPEARPNGARSTDWSTRALAAAAAVAAWTIVFSPQMIVWRVLYGHAFALPQGPSFLQWWAPHPVSVLLSDNHGLFSWTPVIALSVVGLVVFVARHARFRLPLGGLLLAAWYVNAAVADWWGGEAFGARRFLSLFPLFVLGTATWIGSPAVRPKRLAALAALLLLTWLLLLQYELFMKGFPGVAYPKGPYGFWVDRFIVPFRLMARLL